jgi:hypothetical protein
MYDPRWDDARERDDGRACVYGERDRADRDPRHGLMHDLDLPCGEARELVVDRYRSMPIAESATRESPRRSTRA